MFDKVTTAQQAVSRIKSGDTLLVGGFLASGSPETLIGALLKECKASELTVVSNDTGTTDTGMIEVMKQGRVKRVLASYIGANPMTGQMLLNDPCSVTLFPQGTLAEKIRAGGAGIPGFYTPVGVGTVVEQHKEKRTFDGTDCLLELAIKGDVALIHADTADRSGNCYMKGAAKNFGAVMARAADYVIAQADKIVEVGDLDPELITVPGIFVDALVQAEVL